MRGTPATAGRAPGLVPLTFSPPGRSGGIKTMVTARTAESFVGRGYASRMNSGPLVVMGLLSFFFGSCSKQPSQPMATDQPDSKFRAGQVWSFKTPANQPNAKLTVLRVESCGKLGTVIHVALSGVSYGNRQTTIQHLPFSESAVERSVTTLERESGPVPDFSEGYRHWRDAFDAGKGGAFDITVAEAFDAVTNIASNRP